MVLSMGSQSQIQLTERLNNYLERPSCGWLLLSSSNTPLQCRPILTALPKESPMPDSLYMCFLPSLEITCFVCLPVYLVSCSLVSPASRTMPRTGPLMAGKRSAGDRCGMVGCSVTHSEVNLVELDWRCCTAHSHDATGWGH